MEREPLTAVLIDRYCSQTLKTQEDGPAIHAVMSEGSVSNYFDMNTGGNVWLSCAVFFDRDGYIYAQTSIDGVDVYQLPENVNPLNAQDCENFIWDLHGENSRYLIASSF